MPSKIQLDENLWFLYICLQKSDLKSIDFAAVGNATSLKPPAARMRYTRLRRQIESGTLIGTHGAPISGSPTFSVRVEKRKRKNGVETKDDEEENWKAENERLKGVGVKEEKIKEEMHSDDEFESSSESSSEDEMPLAKLRKGKMGMGIGTSPVSPGFIGQGSRYLGTFDTRSTVRAGDFMGPLPIAPFSCAPTCIQYANTDSGMEDDRQNTQAPTGGGVLGENGQYHLGGGWGEEIRETKEKTPKFQ